MTRPDSTSRKPPAFAPGLCILLAIGAGACSQQPRADAPGAGAAAQVAAEPPAQSANPVVEKGMPDPTLTPGERTATTRDTVAPIPEAVQQEVFRSYGVEPGNKRYVLVRLIPPALGGTDTSKNLFPVTPWFANLKARLDKSLAEQVAGGKMTAEQAEKELRENWVQAAHRHYIRNYGQEDEKKAREQEDQKNW